MKKASVRHIINNMVDIVLNHNGDGLETKAHDATSNKKTSKAGGYRDMTAFAVCISDLWPSDQTIKGSHFKYSKNEKGMQTHGR